MNRRIRSPHHDVLAPLEPLPAPPDVLRFPLEPAVNRCDLAPVVSQGDTVAAGAVLAQGPALAVHAPVAGIVETVNERELVLRRDPNAPAPVFGAVPAQPRAADLPGLARDMGWAGMGGSLFPTSIKLKAADRIHTLVVNAVECEPGIQVDEALLVHEAETVAAGIEALVSALGARRTVLAVKSGSRKRLAGLAAAWQAEILAMPHAYPGGAEKLIVGRLEGRLPPAGVLPARQGYLVFSAASLWALGRRLRLGEPSIWRPLTLVPPSGPSRNLLVPVGTPAGHVLAACGVAYDPEGHVLVAGGLMMGRRSAPDAPVLKGTNALFVRPVSERLRRPEAPCILCGSCYDACPLGLHPSAMADRIRDRRRSSALAAQLEECFLCGVCSAVCPADIPLVQYFHEGKAWLREQK